MSVAADSDADSAEDEDVEAAQEAEPRPPRAPVWEDDDDNLLESPYVGQQVSNCLQLHFSVQSKW